LELWSQKAQGDYEEWYSQDNKGSMIVMKGARDRNLYYLKGNTVTGVMAASLDLDEDTTKMWHMKLGHASEKSMQALTK